MASRRKTTGKTAANQRPANASKKPVTKKAATKKPSKKKAAKKTAAKKTVTRKVTKKQALRKPAKVAVKHAPSGAGIRAIAPSRDGAWWTLTLEGGEKVRLASAAAQSAGVRVGAKWTAASARKVHLAAAELELFTRAMALLAENGRLGRTQLARALGGDAAARATVASLAKHGWVA